MSKVDLNKIAKVVQLVKQANVQPKVDMVKVAMVYQAVKQELPLIKTAGKLDMLKKLLQQTGVRAGKFVRNVKNDLTGATAEKAWDRFGDRVADGAEGTRYFDRQLFNKDKVIREGMVQNPKTWRAAQVRKLHELQDRPDFRGYVAAIESSRAAQQLAKAIARQEQTRKMAVGLGGLGIGAGAMSLPFGNGEATPPAAPPSA